jgi:hypothetical protein
MPEGKRTIGIPKGRWMGNIKTDLRERGLYGLDRSGSE